jgi:radical SAM protein with 4Fe4S-binding SPASM domain
MYRHEPLNFDIIDSSRHKHYDINWVDDFIAGIKDYICLREDEKILILVPNQVYQLNDTAVTILAHLLKGKTIASLIASMPHHPEKVRDIEAFMCDLRALMKGCLRDGEHRKAIEYIPYQRSFHRYPILSELALTYRCNAACLFCYVNCPHTKSQEITTEEAQFIIRIIKETAKVPSISFTGGEPTLRNDLFELIHYARQQQLRVNLITNGIIITKDYAMNLKKAGLNSAQVSLESSDESIHDALTSHPGSFQKTIKALQYFTESGIHTHTNSTINQRNKDSLPGLFQLAAKLHLKRLSMNLLMPCGAADSQLKLWISYSETGTILTHLKKAAQLHNIEFMWYSPTPYCLFNPVEHHLGNKTCAAAQGLLSIDPQGNVLPCSSLNKPIGNILKQNFDDIWFSDSASYYRNMLYAPNACKDCSILEICGAACPIYFDRIGTEEIEGKRRRTDRKTGGQDD